MCDVRTTILAGCTGGDRSMIDSPSSKRANPVSAAHLAHASMRSLVPGAVFTWIER